MDTVLELAFEGLRFLGRIVLHVVVEIVAETLGGLCGWIWRRIHGWVVWATGFSELAIPISILLILALIAGAFFTIVAVGQAIFA